MMNDLERRLDDLWMGTPDARVSLIARDALEHLQLLERRLAKAESALELIATPKRPDGTWNRDREACRDLAAKTVASLQDWNRS